MNHFPSTRFIPRGSVKVCDKHSDAVAYVYMSRNDRPAFCLYVGKQNKPLMHYAYKTEAKRNDEVRKAFEARQLQVASKGQRKVENNAQTDEFAATVEVGDIFTTSWGYDQTNVDAYEVVAKSKRMVTVREIQLAKKDLGYDDRYSAVPQSGQFIGEPQRVLIQNGALRIDGHYATRWNTQTIAGVKLGRVLAGGGMH